ncbi:MAG TPA: MFS transporter [candidate division Zixibacteria bacterium]|nr:MFS transporter [candidate division Zixibacteria bacterium]
MFSLTSQNIFQQFYAVFARIAGVSATILGFIMSVRNLLTGLFQGTIGRLSDKIGRKYILIFGFFLSLIIPIPLIFYHEQWFLIFVAIVQAFSVSVVIPTWNAVLGDVTEPSFRATFIGKITSIGRIVSVAITLIVAGIFVLLEIKYNNILTIGGDNFVITWEIQYGIIFAISAFNALLCIICVFLFKETHIITEETKNNIPKLRVALKDKNFVKFLIVNSIFGITMSLIWPANPIILNDILALDFPKVAVMISAFTVFTGLAQIIGGKLADKMGRKPLIIISAIILVFFPVSMIPSIITGNWWILLFSRFVGGVGTGLNLVAINTYTLDLAPRELFGGYSGLRETFYGITTFIGSFIAGFIIDALEPIYGIITTCIAMSIGVTIIRGIAAIGFLFIKESLSENNKNNESSIPNQN